MYNASEGKYGFGQRLNFRGGANPISVKVGGLCGWAVAYRAYLHSGNPLAFAYQNRISMGERHEHGRTTFAYGGVNGVDIRFIARLSWPVII